MKDPSASQPALYRYKSVLLDYSVARDPKTKDVTIVARYQDSKTKAISEKRFTMCQLCTDPGDPMFKPYHRAADLARCLHDMIEREEYGADDTVSGC